MNITELCVNCKQNNSCTMCWKTSKKKCPHFIQKTNADRIRAMSDEELAELLHSIIHESNVIMIEKLKGQGIESTLVEAPLLSIKAHLDWLKQPAEDTE